MTANQFNYLAISENPALSNKFQIKNLILQSMILRYFVGIFAMVFLFVFRHSLPFPFPQFFLVSFLFVLANCFLHLASLKREWLKSTFFLLPYFDSCFAPLVFLASGGFLSPFVITHFVTAIGSGILYTNNKKLPLHSFLILVSSYLIVAFLQKFNIIPCSIDYVRSMLSNNAFFFLIVSITSIIFGLSYIIIKMLNEQVHKMLDDLTYSFDSIVKGTNTTIGQDFFLHLIQHLTQSIMVRCSMVAELTQKNASLQTLAVWKDGKNDENFESPVKGTVFSEVLSQTTYSIDKGIESLYPTNPLLAQCKATFFYGALLKDSKDKPIGLLCMINDKPLKSMYLVEPLMTIFASRAATELERKLAEEKQKIIEMQLAHAHKMEAIGNLVGGIAHDFNNMVSAIGGCAQLLKSKIPSDSPNQRYITHILNAGTHTAELINRLTGFARRDKPHTVPIDVHKVIDDTFILIEGTTNKNIKLIKRLNASQSIIPSNESSLQNALLNIAINARDAMENNGGILTFETSVIMVEKFNPLCESFQIEPGDYISVSVSDTGTGMTEEIMRHLYEPFFTTKPKGKGTGFGLANVWGFIENHKAAINVASKLGVGSTFTLYLPLIQKTSRQSNELHSIPITMPLTIDNVKTILIVDDEEAQREITREILENKDFSLVFRENGLQAVDYLKTEEDKVDLIILDFMMPVMNGHDAFYEIRKIDPEMKILIASGYINNKDLKGIMEDDKTAFLQKPFSEEKLLGAIQRLSAAKK